MFDLSKDASEQHDLAAQTPEKVAELTKLHDAWLAEMPEPIQAGSKRFGMPLPEGTKATKPKDKRKAKTETPAPIAK